MSVVARLTIREEAVEAVKNELLKLIQPTRAEEGCLEYRLHQDNADPRVFIFYENWQNLACLERHINTPHYKSYVAAVADSVTEKVVHKMTCISG